ncbi:restriction endonuclease subunit S [Actinomadura bangladeshensis]|nr:restriction endonuclease subunit S [Actinomadura bangladeshensis]
MANWRDVPLKRIVTSIQSGTSVNGAPWPVQGDELGVLKTSAVYGGVFRPAENKQVDSYDIDRVSCPVLAGSLIVSRMNTKQHLASAAAVLQDYPNLYLPDRLWAVTFHGADPRFIDWWTKTPAYRTQVEAVCVGTSSSMQNISQGDFLGLRIALPDPETQRSIADHLDHETARIDTLIEEQQCLIEMLRERRQAVVDAAFADLGEPRVQLRRYIKFLTSGSRGWGDYYADDGERFLRIGNLPRTNLSIRGGVQFVSLPADVTEGSRTMLEAGDLLFSITAYLGSVAVVDSDWVGSYVSQHVALCRLDSGRLDSRFAGWFMLTTTGQDQLKQEAAGGAKIQLALDDIKGLRVPTASITEQHRIAIHLDEQTAKIDVLIAETQRLIELARERRSALITAAVTGQIDVREAA